MRRKNTVLEKIDTFSEETGLWFGCCSTAKTFCFLT